MKESALTLPETFFDGLDGVLRELVVLDHVVVKVVSQVVGTC
jgi:hypothetical protein